MLVDVSHVVEHGMITYKGLPAPLVCDFLSRAQSRSHYAPGVEFHIGKIEIVANTGAYLDSPFHRYANGKDLSELPLERLANLEGVVVRDDRPFVLPSEALLSPTRRASRSGASETRTPPLKNGQETSPRGESSLYQSTGT